MYEYQCEYCTGTVKPKRIRQEAFKHKKGFVILEDITIGICDSCGNRYYSADILHMVHQLATGQKVAERNELVPAAHFA